MGTSGYPYIHKVNAKNDINEQCKYYAPHIYVTCGRYKNNKKYQFTLSTGYGINTHKDFTSPKKAFDYADEIMLNLCSEAVEAITKEQNEKRNHRRVEAKNAKRSNRGANTRKKSG